MFRLRTTAITLSGHAELVMPNSKVAFLWYRLEKQRNLDGYSVMLRGKPRVIDHVQDQNAISFQVMPKLHLFFKCVGQEKNEPQLMYVGTNPPKKRRPWRT